MQSAFKFAVLNHNLNISARKFELQAYVDVINTADAFKLSRLSKKLPRPARLKLLLTSYFTHHPSLQSIHPRCLRYAGSRLAGLLRHTALVLQHFPDALHYSVVPREGNALDVDERHTDFNSPSTHSRYLPRRPDFWTLPLVCVPTTTRRLLTRSAFTAGRRLHICTTPTMVYCAFSRSTRASNLTSPSK